MTQSRVENQRSMSSVMPRNLFSGGQLGSRNISFSNRGISEQPWYEQVIDISKASLIEHIILYVDCCILLWIQKLRMIRSLLE